MYVQLTHLRPKADCYGELVAALDSWGAQVRKAEQPEYAFVSRAEDHVFVVAVYKNEEDYRTAAERQKNLLDSIAHLLVENHGPTFSGEVLRFFDRDNPEAPKDSIAHGIQIDVHELL